MGDNALKKWDWHNTIVGEGYAAKGVIRQKTAVTASLGKIVDMSSTTVSSEVLRQDGDDRESKHKKGKRKREKEKKSKHKKRHKNKSDTNKNGFNPLLQLLASRLSDSSTSFLS
jgi:hypothetical protein